MQSGATGVWLGQDDCLTVTKRLGAIEDRIVLRSDAFALKVQSTRYGSVGAAVGSYLADPHLCKEHAPGADPTQTSTVPSQYLKLGWSWRL